jgi:predicted nucleotidyltransferase
MPMSLPSQPLNKEKALEIIKDFTKEILPSEVWYQDITQHIKAIILYGSVAKGINRPDSDIDILIILPLEIEEKYTKGEYCYKYQNQEINIVMRSEERIESLALKHNDTFQAEVFRGYEIIWQKDNKIKKLIDRILLEH